MRYVYESRTSTVGEGREKKRKEEKGKEKKNIGSRARSIVRAWVSFRCVQPCARNKSEMACVARFTHDAYVHVHVRPLPRGGREKMDLLRSLRVLYLHNARVAGRRVVFSARDA